MSARTFAAEINTPTDAMDHQQAPRDSDDRQVLLQRLGARLREGREQRGLSLQDLATQLHMGVEQLQALEAGDEANLPEPVFVIAQARRLADALGIDISLLLAPLKQPSTLVAAAAAPSRSQPPASTRDARRPWPFLAAAAGMAAMAALGVWAWPLLRRQPSPEPARARAASPQPPAGPGTLRLQSPQPSWLEVQSSSGAVLFRGSLQGERSFPLAGGLRVKAGRPDLVQASLGNGPARALGPIEVIRWVSFPAPGATAPAP